MATLDPQRQQQQQHQQLEHQQHQHQQQQPQDTLETDMDPNRGMKPHADLNATTFRQLFLKFAEVTYESVHGAFHFLSEMEYVIKLLFPKFLAPVLHGQVSPSEVSRLVANIQPTMKRSLNKLYLRAVSSADFNAAPNELTARGGDGASLVVVVECVVLIPSNSYPFFFDVLSPLSTSFSLHLFPPLPPPPLASPQATSPNGIRTFPCIQSTC